MNMSATQNGLYEKLKIELNKIKPAKDEEGKSTILILSSYKVPAPTGGPVPDQMAFMGGDTPMSEEDLELEARYKRVQNNSHEIRKQNKFWH